MPRRKRLTDAGIARLRAQAREYTVWDTQVAGLGVRVRSSGSKTWVYHRKTEAGVRKMSFGPAALRRAEEVRRECLAAAAVMDDVDGDARGAPAETPLFRDFVTGSWKAACYDRCKPSTQKNNRYLLMHQLLPAFGSRRLNRITRGAVLRWFEEYSWTAPGGANKALNLLAQIFGHGVTCGLVTINPARGIRRNPGRKFTRFLSREEIARLHQALDRYAQGTASQAQQADIIRLLLLTGCRKSEIVRLRREEVREDRLELVDSKTGPRTVLLNAPARQIVERRMAQGNSLWVFPSVLDPSRSRCLGVSLWYRIRREADIQDVRLHDLRHTFASRALALGETLPVIGKLLGHNDIETTARYAHLAQDSVHEAAERVAESIAEDICCM